MTRNDKWIRSVKDNPAGKVDPEGNRWEWDQSEKDDTLRLLDKLNNDELSIEQTDLFERPAGGEQEAAPTRGRAKPRATPDEPPKKGRGRDAGGGFNPYDSSSKPRRR